MNVRDVMSEDPVHVQVDTPVSEVVELIQELAVRHLPVLDGDRLVGIVSDRDLRSVTLPRLVDAVALTKIQARYEQAVSQLMSSDPVTVHPENDLVEAVDAMLEHHVGALPVVDPSTGDLVGMISYVDVLAASRPLLSE